jgi:hypothetical protein
MPSTSSYQVYVRDLLRTTATLHHALVLRHVATEPLFLIYIPLPGFLERVQGKFHNLRQDFALALFLYTLDEFV